MRIRRNWLSGSGGSTSHGSGQKVQAIAAAMIAQPISAGRTADQCDA